MTSTNHSCDVVVVGGGPAGIAAAVAAAECRERVIILDDNPALGGQIWRADAGRISAPQAAPWLMRLHRSTVEIFRWRTRGRYHRTKHSPHGIPGRRSAPD